MAISFCCGQVFVGIKRHFKILVEVVVYFIYSLKNIHDQSTKSGNRRVVCFLHTDMCAPPLHNGAGIHTFGLVDGFLVTSGARNSQGLFVFGRGVG